MLKRDLRSIIHMLSFLVASYIQKAQPNVNIFCWLLGLSRFSSCTQYIFSYIQQWEGKLKITLCVAYTNWQFVWVIRIENLYKFFHVIPIPTSTFMCSISHSSPSPLPYSLGSRWRNPPCWPRSLWKHVSWCPHVHLNQDLMPLVQEDWRELEVLRSCFLHRCLRHSFPRPRLRSAHWVCPRAPPCC